MKKMKIRYLHTLQFPKTFNLWKLSRKGNLIIGEETLIIKSDVHHIVIKEILEVSRVDTGHLDFNTWIKLQSETPSGKVQEIFLTDGRFFRGSKEIFDLLFSQMSAS